MERVDHEVAPLRAVIGWSVLGCVAVAMAPWLSGGQEPLGLLISGFALLIAVVLLMQQPCVRRLRGGPLTWIYTAVVGWAALSLIWSVNRYSTVMWVVMLLLAGLAFRVVYAVVQDEMWRRRLVSLYLVTVALFSSYALWLYLTSGYERLTGSFYWPNPAAAYLIPAILLGFDAWRRAGGKWLKVPQAVWYGAATVIFSINFVLTDSRAAALVLAILVVIYIVATDKNRTLWIKFVFNIAMVIVGVAGVAWLRHELQPKAVAIAPGTRVIAVANGSSQSGSDRLAYLGSAFAIWSDHPLIGTGAGTYGDVHPRYQTRVVSAANSAHNIYVQTLPEQGIIGAFLVLWWLVVLVVGMGRGLWLSRGVTLPLALGASGLLLHMGVDIDAQYPALIMLTGGLVAAAYGQRPAYGRLGWRLPLMLLLVLVPVVSVYLGDAAAQRGRRAQADGDYETAAGYFAKAHSYPVYNPDILTAQGIDEYTLAETGMPGAAKAALGLARAAEHQDRADGQHYQLEGRVWALGHDSAGAQKAYRRALELDPYNHPEYAYDLALSQAQAGDVKAAIVTGEAMLAQYPAQVVSNRSADPQLRSNLAELAALVGSVKLQQGDLVGARAASQQASGFDKTNLRAQALAGLLQRVVEATP